MEIHKIFSVLIAYIIVQCAEPRENRIFYEASMQNLENETKLSELKAQGVEAVILKECLNESQHKLSELILQAHELELKVLVEFHSKQCEKSFAEAEETLKHFDENIGAMHESSVLEAFDGYKINCKDCSALQSLLDSFKESFLSKDLIIIESGNCDFNMSSHLVVLNEIEEINNIRNSVRFGWKLQSQPFSSEAKILNFIKVLLPGFLIIESFESFPELSAFIQLRQSEIFKKGAFTLSKTSNDFIILKRELESISSFSVIGNLNEAITVLQLDEIKGSKVAASSKESKYQIG